MSADDQLYRERFTFTGKEWCKSLWLAQRRLVHGFSETGFSYFGARYYDSDLSGLFLSVDPMADKYPSISPYAYCAWNPLKLVDPNGRKIWIVGDDGNIYQYKEGGLYTADNEKYDGYDAFVNKIGDCLKYGFNDRRRCCHFSVRS